MADDIFEYLTQMYARSEAQFEKLNHRMDRLESNMVRMEFDMKEQNAILHDAVRVNTERLDHHSNLITILSDKVEMNTIAINKNSEDIKKNSEDIKKNSDDITDLSNRMEKVEKILKRHDSKLRIVK